MGQIPTLVTFVAGNKIKSSEFNNNNDAIKNTYNAHENNTTDSHGITSPSVIVGTMETQTLTNKTLTSPTVDTPTINTPTINTPTINNGDVNLPNIKAQKNTEVTLSSETIDMNEGDSFYHIISASKNYTITNIPATGFKQITLLVSSSSGATVSFTNTIKKSYGVGFSSNANVVNMYTICAINGVLYGNCLASMS